MCVAVCLLWGRPWARQPERPHVDISCPQHFKHHQNSTRRLPERHIKSENCGGRGEKKTKFWAPTLRGRGREGEEGQWTTLASPFVLCCVVCGVGWLLCFFFFWRQTDEKEHSHNSIRAHETSTTMHALCPHTLRATAWSRSTSCEGGI